MTVQQKLLSLWVLLLLMAALCPQLADGKRGGIFKGRGKGDGNKPPSSKSQGLSKQGLKLAGAAAAAGILGGTGTGYGLGFLGKPKHHGGRHGHKSSSEKDQRPHRDEGRGRQNQSLWRALVNTATPAHPTNIFLTVGQVASFLVAAWIADI
ncbi:shadow of prion protein 2 [Hippoglossus hippoglossus]|uniref:shadow of prion protein 2 n=1 Tax=Hippoglossus hippoglossus TaxID=8267 RepID=UPI00148D4242|nr:shadow of prion protein 2 [Hippoglossus hippoglossus]XP_035039924.1 shadow of prion protein 2 [Hippoglossus stenolepis]